MCLQGGFQTEMTRREAALILGIREHAKEEAVKDAHRKIMIANHPDAGKFAHSPSASPQCFQSHLKITWAWNGAPLVGHPSVTSSLPPHFSFLAEFRSWLFVDAAAGSKNW